MAHQDQEAISNRPMREMTVGELLDRRIDKAERLVRALSDLKASLPGSYLDSGASRISAFIEF
jgi:hypothetical protein